MAREQLSVGDDTRAAQLAESVATITAPPAVSGQPAPERRAVPHLQCPRHAPAPQLPTPRRYVPHSL